MRRNSFVIVITIAVISFNVVSARAGDGDRNSFLDRVEKEAFGYFWNETDPRTGFTSNTSEQGSPASNAAAGFMLSSLIVGIERGWISKDEAYRRALTTLKSFQKLDEFQGFTYHYFNIDTGSRMWNSEVSCIDSGLFLAGVITIGEYFKGTEVGTLSDTIFRKADWQWFLDGKNVLQMSWKPESSFCAQINTLSEGILCYILAMGSPTYPIPKKCWDSFARPISTYGDNKLIYVTDGSLFQYLFPLAWLDLKDKHDTYADYWRNAIKAVKANKQYCIDNAAHAETYKKGFWGLSASMSSQGYKIFGAKPGKNIHNGTVAPYAVGGSIPLTPEFSIDDYRAMYEKYPAAVGRYGLVDAFNVGQHWAAADYISIDIGLTLLMVENYRTGLIWKYFMQSPYVREALKKTGFVDGRQDEPSRLTYLAGNPNDTIAAGRTKSSISVDGELSEWKDAAKLTLTSVDNKNIELNLGSAKDDTDVSGVFYVAWDDNNLYIAGEVKDNDIVCSRVKDKIYEDDCVEIFFDINEDGYRFDGNAHDYQLGIAPSSPGRKPQLWAWGYRNRVPADIQYAVRDAKDGYAVETAIPFSEISGFTPTKGERVGFSISIHDRDRDGSTKKLTWSIDTSRQEGNIFFGTLFLAD